MADRYWVGGSGSWDATTTTNWSATSGGAGGASAPTSSDNVIFNSASNATLYTVTVGTNAVCADMTAAGPLVGNVTFSLGATAVINCHSSFTLAATGITWTATTGSAVNFLATSTGKTITTNGVSLGATICTFDGVGGAWSLGSAFTSTNNIIVTNGSFNSANFNITIVNLGSSNANIRSISLGSSTITLSAAIPINFTNSTNLTFNAGTSTITCSNASPTFNGGGQTFYNVNFTSAATGTTTITGANTFNDLNQTSRSAAGLRVVSIGANQTVSGTLTLGAANTSIRRIQVQSDTIGTQLTITLNGTLATLADVDFRNIATAGSVGTWTGTRLGNGLGNSGITFDAAKDVYWNLAAGGNTTGTAWALSSGGAVNANNFPLAQDRIIIENTGLNSGATISIASGIYWFGEFDFSTRTLPMTFANGNIQVIAYKNVTLSSSVTMTGTSNWVFQGQGTTQILDVNTATFVPPITIDSPSGTLQLAENTTCSDTVTLTSGTLDLNNNVLTALTFSSSNSNTRSIAFGTGNINLTGNAATIWTTATATGFSYTGTPTINATYSGSTGTRTFNTGTTGTITEANALSFNITAGTDIVTILNNHALRSLNFTGFAGSFTTNNRTIYGNLTVSSGMTLVSGTSTTTFVATSGTQTITTNGNTTIDFPITQNGVGGTVQLQDNLTIGATRTYTLTNGTLNVNGKTLTTGIFSSSNSNTRVLNLGTNGKIAVNGGNFTATVTGFTFSGTGTISMDFATAKTFAGGGGVYPYTLNQGGAGTLTITGANTFDNITDTVQPCTITFPANTTTTVNNFNVNGTAGNLVSLQSSTPGTRYTLSRNLVLDPFFINVNYVDVRDAIGSPDLKWYVGKNSVNSGNNLQIYFEQSPAANLDINGVATFTVAGLRMRLSNGDVLGQALFSGSANKIVASSANITGEGVVAASAGKRTNGSAAISSNGQFSANGKIIGEEWTEIPQGSEVWYEN